MEIHNKTVVITGGAQGLGKTMALNIANQGARLALIDINEEKLMEVKKACQESGSTCNIYPVNITNEQATEALFQTIVQDFPKIDCLINNAGIIRDGLLIKTDNNKVINKMSLQQWQSVIDTNLTGAFLCGREAAALMIEQQTPGVIINISSISKAGNIGQSNYAASKAGVAALTVCWAKELAPYSIRVAGIAPGFIATEMTESIKPEILNRLVAKVPLKCMGNTNEVAHAAKFIIENDYFTGRIIELDGGLRL